MVDRSEEIDKDAWLLQAIGGSAKYGNGLGGLVHIGRVPSGTSDPDYKSRGIFQIPLRNGSTGILDGAASLSAADIEFTVGGQGCLVGGRGAQFYAFLEEIPSVSFTEFNAGGDCNFGSSGPASGEWGIDSGAVTTNRVFKSSPGLALGDKVAFNITAMAQAWLDDPAKDVAWFRIIFANSAGTAYDETAGAVRGTGFYASENGTPTNRPVMHATVGTGNVAKSGSDTGSGADSQSIVQQGTSPSDQDSGVGTDAVVYAGPVSNWSTVITDAEDGSGVGQVVVPKGWSNVTEQLAGVSRSQSLLLAVSEDDVEIAVRFQMDKIPAVGGSAWFRLIGRAQDKDHFYACSAQCGVGGIGLNLEAYTSGSAYGSLLAILVNIRPALVATDYWMKMLLTGASPTIVAGKLWRTDEQEPVAYQITAQSSTSGLQVAGAVGLGVSMSDVSNKPITFTFDEFTARSM